MLESPPASVSSVTAGKGALYRLPQVGKALGKTIREFRKVQDDAEEVVKSGTDASANELESEKS